MSAPAAHTTVQSFLILGTDAVLAAHPATAVQLAHACAAVGFDVVVPASWGDEIIARSVAERVRDSQAPVVQCSCPLVARRFADHAGVLDSMVVRFVPPPVATARYLRAIYGPRPLRIAYAGDCPVSSVDSIDEHLSCAALFDRLEQRGVDPTIQPTEYDSVIPPDRRRHFSEPGGLPSTQSLRWLGGGHEVIELSSGDVAAEVAQHLVSGEPAILDIAIAAGCRCSGAIEGASADARARVRAQEPPRSTAPIVDHSVVVFVETEATPANATPPAVQAQPPLADSNGDEREAVAALVTADTTSRRRSPAGSTRAVMGAMPLSRGDAGRQLPRLYVARRRSSPRGMRQSVVRREAPSAEAPSAEAPSADAPSAAAPVADRSRWVMIAAIGLVTGILIAVTLAAIF